MIRSLTFALRRDPANRRHIGYHDNQQNIAYKVTKQIRGKRPMCTYHYDPAASSNIYNLVKTITAENTEATRGQCRQTVDEKLKPRWVDHTDQECEPIKIMEVLNEAGDYCPAATLVIKGNPLRSPLSLHYRLDYTIRIPNKRTWLARLFRRPHGRPAMRYVEGTYPEIMMATAATSGLTEIIYQEANRGLLEALEKGRIYTG